MKLFKLWVHQHTFCEDALIVNPKEFPDCHIGDVLEIYHPDEQTKSKCLLLQINSIRNDFQQKDTISIEQSVANWFQLRTYSDVIVHKVEHSDVEVDLVEVVVKDQYMSRNDMWRLSKALVGRCVYISKKMSFCGLRGQIHELWKKGKQMTCGVISKDTRVVYRSLSAQIFLYIQMSCEMWEFDLHGDLYFEKVINGFLYELFSQWKKKKANHEVTIVLFSRRFYQSEDVFPDKRKSVLRDPHGRYYEDFYQVLVRGERKDDWLPVLVTLKYHINQYQKYTNCQGESAVGINSTAHEGNFLEAINLSMNIFEKHYQDRNFDCTGQSILVVTPGTGVFEVDRSLNSITKQRMIDSGVAVDLVCMAEQPLHSVPLLKFFDKGSESEVKLGDDYNIPHWMNHSFYASPKSLDKHNSFVPRIQLPDVVLNWFGVDTENNKFSKGLHKNFQPKNAKEQEPNQILDFVNFDEFDAKIFCKKISRRPKEKFKKNKSAPLFHAVASETDFDRLTSMSQEDLSVTSGNFPNAREQGLCIPNARNSYSDKSFMSSSLGHVPNDNYLSEVWSKKDDRKELRDELLDVNLSPVVGSADAPRKLVGFPAKHLNDPRRTLFNPFKPLNIPCRWTCNRHRWAHSFPKGQDGIVIHRQFLKHSKRVPRVAQRDDEMSNNKELESDCTTQDKQYKMQEKLTLKRRKGHIRTKAHHHLDAIEQDWTAEVETSVDWKSLILPACLPLTSEYCPDMKTLDTGYLEFHYELCIGDDDDSCGNEFMVSKPRSSSNPPRYDDQVNSHPVSVSTMITELVAQRLSKGFQILTDPPHQERPTFSTFMSTDHDFEAEEYFLSIGRNIHRLSVVPKQSQINVTRYRPRHIRGLEPINYWYQLHIGRTLSSNLQETEFQHDELDKYNWNYLDQHISGIQDFAEMVESLRYWKSRFLLLPMTHRKKPSGDNNGSVDESAYIEGMIKYLEALNGIKGSKVPRRPTSPLVSHKTSILKPYNTHDKHIPNVADNKMESKDAEAQGRAHGNKSLGDSTSCDIKNNSLETSHVSEEDILTANSPLERIVEDIMDTLSGFSFLPTTKGLQPYSFISIHCVEWMMRSVKGLNGRRDCMMLAQKMVDAKIIQHASGNPNQQFVYGFVIFYITSKDNWKTSKETTSNNLEAPYASMMFEDFHQKFQEEWFEVIFDCTHTMPSFLASDEEILQYYESYPDIKHVPFGKRGRAKSTSQIPHQQDCAIGPAYKTVHINCDLQRKSNRNEFAIIRYHGNYCNSHAFEFEVHWIEATGSIVHDLVQGWARKASSCGFHLVPVPVSPFPDRLGNNMDPLRLPVFIPVDVTVIQDVLKSFESSVYQLRVFLFLEAILNKFEFLKDSPCRRLLDKPYIMTPPVQCRANYYIHTSGVACAHIIDQDSAAELRTERVGYYWTKNFTLTKKWRSSSTGDGEFSSKLLTDFRQFCSNACGSLEALCESLQEKSEESVSTH